MTTDITVRQPQHTFADLERMALAVAKSGLFGVKTPEAALTLMLIAQEEGTGVAAACRDFHIIDGKPTLKVDAMLARFQASGGRVEWHELTDQKVEATFSHPASSPLRLAWTWDMAVKAKLNLKDNWAKYPRAMLRSRVVSEGIRSVSPGSIVGIYEVNELRDGVEEEIDVTPPRDAATVELSRKTEQEVIDVETGEIKAAAPTEATSDAPPGMNDAELTDHLNAIDAAPTLTELKNAYAKGYARAHGAHDLEALRLMLKAKDEAKARLTRRVPA